MANAILLPGHPLAGCGCQGVGFQSAKLSCQQSPPSSARLAQSAAMVASSTPLCLPIYPTSFSPFRGHSTQKLKSQGQDDAFLGRSVSWRCRQLTRKQPVLPGEGSHGSVISASAAPVKRRKPKDKGADSRKPALYIQVEPDGSDAWRVDAVVDIIKRGGVGVLPTDTMYAFVCDLGSPEAIMTLYSIKSMDARKPLSILCRSFGDIDEYTQGFPFAGNGQRSLFRTARNCLPGPYTLILPASKSMPKQCVEYGQKGRSCVAFAQRKSVGVRMPDSPFVTRIMEQLDRPLISTSVTSSEADLWMLDPAEISDLYGRRGVDFVVDAGLMTCEPSTVIDFTGEEPVILRRGRGTVEPWGDLKDENPDVNSRNPYLPGVEVQQLLTAQEATLAE